MNWMFVIGQGYMRTKSRRLELTFFINTCIDWGLIIRLLECLERSQIYFGDTEGLLFHCWRRHCMIQKLIGEFEGSIILEFKRIQPF